MKKSLKHYTFVFFGFLPTLKQSGLKSSIYTVMLYVEFFKKFWIIIHNWWVFKVKESNSIFIWYRTSYDLSNNQKREKSFKGLFLSRLLFSIWRRNSRKLDLDTTGQEYQKPEAFKKSVTRLTFSHQIKVKQSKKWMKGELEKKVSKI